MRSDNDDKNKANFYSIMKFNVLDIHIEKKKTTQTSPFKVIM